jgi:hypothetical protein
VVDAAGGVVGAVVRVPWLPLKHTWRTEQPERPDIVGRNPWAGMTAGELAVVGGVKAFTEVMQAVADLRVDGGDRAAKSEAGTLLWKARGETVMISEGTQRIEVEADWPDRRPAVAFALLGDR